MSIVLPVYRLESVIVENVDLVFDALGDLEPEVILVDDGSNDGTADAIARAALRHPIKSVTLPVNRGKGRALLEGWKIATGDYIVFLDADLDLPPHQIPELIDQLISSDVDVLVGTKKTTMRGSYPGVRRILSRVFALLTEGIFRLPVSETQTGLKVFRRKVLETVAGNVRVDRYAFDLELLARAHAAGFELSETPVTLSPGAATASLRPSMMWSLARDTLRIAWWKLTDPSFRRPS